MKRHVKMILAASLAAALLVGCGTSDASKGDQALNASAGTDASASTSGVQPRAGKTVNVALSENLISLDPLDQANIIGNLQNNLVYEPLVWYDGEGGYDPLLAEKWEYSEDGTVWTFHLRKGVKFHNGEDFDADDVACTFQRILDNKDSLNNPLQYWTELESYEVVDPYTFEIHLSEPYATVLLSMYFTPIIPNEAFAQLGETLWTGQKMYGTGPWVFDEWIDGQYCHYTKNEEYWDRANYDSYYDELYIRYITETSTGVASHIAGDVQVNIASGGLNPDMIPLYKSAEDKIDLISIESGSHHYIGFSFKEGSPFLDINVRKAFNSAIDRESIVNNILGGGTVPNGIIVSTDIGYNPDIEGYTYNPDEARRLLAESSYNGEEIELCCNVSALKGEAILLAISEMLNEVGFKTSVSVVEVATLSDMRRTGDYDTFLVANMHASNDPGNTLTFRILNDAHHSGYVNEELNERIQQSNQEIDVEKRTEILKEIAALMDKENAPHTAICQFELKYAMDKGVTGLELYNEGWFNVKHIDFDDGN